MIQNLKKIIVSIIVIIITIPFLHAQVNTGMNYQAVARDNTGNVLADKNVTVVLSIQDKDGLSLWVESHDLITSPQGMFTISLGTDKSKVTEQKVDNLADIEWNTGPYTLAVQVDPGTGLIEMGANTIHAVPVAFYGKDEDSDPENEMQDIQLNAGTLTITKNTSATNIDLSGFVASEMAWQKQADMVLLPTGNVGVGTDTPEAVMDIKGSLPGDEPIFQVKNDQGIPVFAVYNEGVRVYIPEDLPLTKGVKGGFAVGGYNSAKVLSTDDYFMHVMPEASKISFFTDESTKSDDSKGLKGGFAVGGYNATSKATSTSFIYMDPYAVPITYDGGTIILLPLFDALNEKGNCYIGTMAGQKHEGHFNTSIGYQSGYSADAYRAPFPSLLAYNAAYNTNLGAFSGYANVIGDRNVYMGYQSGYNNTGSGNVFIGYQSGSSYSTSNNIFYLDNESTTTPMFAGDFANDNLRINATVGIGVSSSSSYGLRVDGGISTAYSMYVYRGAYAAGNGFVSASDARLKMDIKPLSDALQKIEQLQGVTFKWTDEANDLETNNEFIGLIAQDVEEIFPEVVSENADGYKGIAYDKLTAVLIEAVKEQQKIIEANEIRLAKQEEELYSLKSAPSNEELKKSLEEMQAIVEALSEKVSELELK